MREGWKEKCNNKRLRYNYELLISNLIKFYDMPVMRALFGEHSVNIGIDYLEIRKNEDHILFVVCLKYFTTDPWYLISCDYWPELQQGLYVECVCLCYHGAVKLISVLEGDIMSWANLFLPNIATDSAVNLAQNVAFTHIELHLGYPSRSIFSAFSINRNLIILFKLSSSKNEIKNLCILAGRENLIRLERAQ